MEAEMVQNNDKSVTKKITRVRKQLNAMMHYN
jgi:hypothetical protein